MNNFYKKIRGFLKKEIHLLRQYGKTARFDTSDIAQESCIQMFRDYPECAGQDKLPESLLKQVAFGHLAKQHRHIHSKKRSVAREQSFSQDVATDKNLPGDQAEANELTTRLIKSIQQLEPDQQRVIRLRSFEELSFVEIASRMNTTVRVVRRIHENAASNLRSMLEQP